MSMPPIMPFTTPVIVPNKIKRGATIKTAFICWMNNTYAIKSWAALWNNAPIRLSPTGPKSLGNNENIIPIAAVLDMPPQKLIINPGPRNVPMNIEDIITLISVTIIAAEAVKDESRKRDYVRDTEPEPGDRRRQKVFKAVDCNGIS